MIDTHCHLNLAQFDSDRADIIAQMPAKGVQAVINVGCNLASSHKAVEIAQEYENCYASVGLHPSDAADWNDALESHFESMAADPKVVAIGETGLDYYNYDGNRDIQKNAFIAQIRLAKKLNLPLIVHQREVGRDALEILAAERPEKFVLHCFTGPNELLDEFLEIGALISFTGIITYKNAESVREAVSKVPLDRIMSETDSPYLAPQSVRGERNTPLNIEEIIAKIAEVKNISLAECKDILKANARDFWSIDLD